MFRNYLVTAVRNFARHKLYSVINIVGLAVGLACAIFIILFIRDELSYDTWIADSQNVYRVELTYHLPGRNDTFSYVPFPAPIAMRDQIPEVQAETYLTPLGRSVKVGNRLFQERIDDVDPNFFKALKLPLVVGNPATVLSQPDSIVLSQTTAKKFFGTTDTIGKTVTLDNSGINYPFTVRGILRDLPHNSQLTADIVIPNTSKRFFPPLFRKAWLGLSGYGYVRLAPGADPATVLAKMKPILDKSIDVRKILKINNLAGSQVLQLHLTPFRDVHLSPIGDQNMTAPGSWTTVYGFAAIAALILAIACFNFMNLATARAMIRAREVSLRKVMGAHRTQLIAQFLGESVLTAMIALVLALAIVEVLTPAYDSFLGRPIAFHYLAEWPLTLIVIAIAAAAGLIGGVYPALVLSGFRPASILGTSGSGIERLRHPAHVACGAAIRDFDRPRHRRHRRLRADPLCSARSAGLRPAQSGCD